MTDEHLPADPADSNDRLPARQDPDLKRALLRSDGRGGAIGLGLVDERDEDDSDEIDLRKYWLVLLKHRWLVLSIVAAITALALLSTLMTTPIYRASALVQVDRATASVVQTQEAQQLGGYWNDEYLQTQLELLKSRSLADRVAASLNLDKSALVRLENPGWLARVKGMVGSPPKAAREQGSVATTPAEAAQLSKELSGAISGGLSVARVPEASLVWISYDSPSPDFSVRVVNAIAEGFAESNLDRRSSATTNAKMFLEEQLKLTKGKLEESERKLIEYARTQGLVITDEKGRTLAAQNLTQLSAALATAQQERIRAESRWRQSATSTEMLTASAVGPLQQQRAVLMGNISRNWGCSSRIIRRCSS
ncbi:GumC family protein [Thermomonas carbonis]|uniref:Polysaccharide chain length determinant N-terminal domain-containing protein n=1 Tax=Thermomonas carbonis TaxID=1463158 RepID=A0A7G9SN18_9GAMM|nr:Wzz/FepE/Etk N-terminal domain-containing protein [Thermomonas carbonis]QNN69243.1 hypothetical protein H9L16_11225 [Thermomonas carbonis]